MQILHQAIYILDVDVNLIRPMQLRDNYVEVNDLPKSMQDNPTISIHAIIALTITLSLKGIVSYFTVSTKEDWENSPLEKRFDLTYESPI